MWFQDLKGGFPGVGAVGAVGIVVAVVADVEGKVVGAQMGRTILLRRA